MALNRPMLNEDIAIMYRDNQVHVHSLLNALTGRTKEAGRTNQANGSAIFKGVIARRTLATISCRVVGFVRSVMAQGAIDRRRLTSLLTRRAT